MSELEMKIEALIRCVPEDAYRKAIAEVSENKKAVPHDLEFVIRDALREIGMPNTLSGFDRCAKAIEIVWEDPTILHYITKGLYFKVAEAFNSTPSKVERAMRHAIEVSWNRFGSELREEYFNSISNIRKDVPTVSEFIGGMYEIVRMKMR